MPNDNLFDVGKRVDTGLFLLAESIPSTPGMTVLLGVNMDSPSVRAIRVDATGRLLVNPSSQRFDIVNTVLADTQQQVFAGASVFRRVVFYVQNANADIAFRRTDNTITPSITAVPNTPLTVEGVFLAILANNHTAGVPSTLQAVINSDLLTGQ